MLSLSGGFGEEAAHHKALALAEEVDADDLLTLDAASLCSSGAGTPVYAAAASETGAAASFASLLFLANRAGASSSFFTESILP
jgi:hypothetical protein